MGADFGATRGLLLTVATCETHVCPDIAWTRCECVRVQKCLCVCVRARAIASVCACVGVNPLGKLSPPSCSTSSRDESGESGVRIQRRPWRES